MKGNLDLAMISNALIKRQITSDVEKEKVLKVREKDEGQVLLPTLLIYGGKDPDRREGEKYYHKIFGKKLSIKVVADADHNFSSWKCKQQVIDHIFAWLSKEEGFMVS